MTTAAHASRILGAIVQAAGGTVTITEEMLEAGCQLEITGDRANRTYTLTAVNCQRPPQPLPTELDPVLIPKNP